MPSIKQAAETMLNNVILPFWMKLKDEEHGGVYWSCDYLGRPLDTTKHTYNQGFAIYALSAYYRLTGELRALTRALEIFRLIENRCDCVAQRCALIERNSAYLASLEK